MLTGHWLRGRPTRGRGAAHPSEGSKAAHFPAHNDLKQGGSTPHPTPPTMFVTGNGGLRRGLEVGFLMTVQAETFGNDSFQDSSPGKFLGIQL